MSNVSGIKPQTILPPVQAPKVGGDADGDNDATKAAAPIPSIPFIAKPTATLGNNVNVTA
jgi:hypothetical protein